MAAPLNADVKNNILVSCEALLAANPFSKISLTDIAQHAGISKGTLHYYYGSKDEILFDVTDRYLGRLAQKLLDWTADQSKDTSYKRLVRYALKSGIFDESGSIRLHLVAAAVSGNEAVRQKLLQKYNDFWQMLEMKIAERHVGEDAGYHAWMVLLLMDGLLVQNQLHNPGISIDEFIDKTVEKMDADTH